MFVILSCLFYFEMLYHLGVVGEGQGIPLAFVLWAGVLAVVLILS